MTRRVFNAMPRLFEGRSVLVLGGGPSVSRLDLAAARGAAAITVNNSWYLMPEAPVAFFGDSRWWWLFGNRERMLAGYAGRIVTSALDLKNCSHPRLHNLGCDFKSEVSVDPAILAGLDSGTKATNLAFHLGARRIVLAGLDMRFDGERSHWHSGHQIPSVEQRYKDRFAPRLNRMILAIKGLGVDVVRCTEPGPEAANFMPLADALIIK